MSYKKKEVIGDATLYLGDCMEVMPTLGEVDAVVTDPPYGIGIDGQKESIKNGIQIRKHHTKKNWDNKIPCKEIFEEIIKYDSIIWGGNYFTEYLPPKKGWLIWDKEQYGLTMSDGEMAWTNLNIVMRIKKMHRTHLWKEKPDHPTQKPVKLMMWCISHLPDKSNLILDPFMGSGTTGVACLQMGRKFIGIEKDPEYFEIACERIKRENDQLKLF